MYSLGRRGGIRAKTWAIVDCSVVLCTDLPPGVSLSSAAGQVGGLLRAFCWTNPQQRSAACTAAPQSLDVPESLAVVQGERLSLRWNASLAPSTSSVAVSGASLGPPSGTAALPAGNPSTFTIDLPVGVSYLTVNAEWVGNGSASYVFKVNGVVRPATTAIAPPIRRELARTGSDVPLAAAATSLAVGLLLLAGARRRRLASD